MEYYLLGCFAALTITLSFFEEEDGRLSIGVVFMATLLSWLTVAGVFVTSLCNLYDEE